MKVVFIDIDGVMNCQEEMLTLLEQNPKAHDKIDLPSPTKCKLLKQLVDETGAEIILSSSWRLNLHAIQNIIDTFRPYGLRLDGFTCEGVLCSMLNETKYKNIKPKHTHHCYEGICIDDRGAEIAYWLLRHPEVTNFVILDDEPFDIIEWFPNNLVKTDPNIGFTLNDCLEAIKILNGGKENGT